MGIENFLFKKPKEEEEEIPDYELNPKTKEKSSKAGMTRRGFLQGTAAVAVGSALGDVLMKGEANAAEKKSYAVNSPEGMEINVQNIEAYQAAFIRDRYVFYDPAATKTELDKRLFFNSRKTGGNQLPVLEREYLKGTKFDHEAIYRKNGSWPSVQISSASGETIIRFAHELGPESEALTYYGNGFFLGGNLITNAHIASKFTDGKFICEEFSGGTADIAGCSLRDIDADDEFRSNAALIDYPIDRRMRDRDVFGEYVDATAIHEQRGTGIDRTDITPGVWVKITPVVHQLYFSEFYNLEKEKLLNSYMYIVAPRDTNKDGKANTKDVDGISAGPTFAHSDAVNKGKSPMVGLMWGMRQIKNDFDKTWHTVMFAHGPDILIRMIDQINTIVSGFMDEKQFPQKKALTEKVQSRLVELGYKITVDGDYGEYTQRAVRTFQERVFTKEEMDSKVIPDVVDRMTWDVLFPDEAGVNKKKLYASIMPVDLVM